MRKQSTLGILFPPILFLAGTYLLYESTARPEWYMDAYLIVGASISAFGLITVYWSIQRQLSIRRLQQHVRGHR